jgi:hypothetical protein
MTDQRLMWLLLACPPRLDSTLPPPSPSSLQSGEAVLRASWFGSLIVSVCAPSHSLTHSLSLSLPVTTPLLLSAAPCTPMRLT